MRLLNIEGERYGRLVVIRRLPAEPGKWIYKVECACDCGARTTVLFNSLRKGTTQSCGCLHRDLLKASKLRLVHGDAAKTGNTPEYNCWQSMRRRCLDPKARSYDRYGGRGIRVCAAWDDYQQFLKDMGRKPTPNHSIDRIDSQGNYEPSNCRWATRREQAQNRRSSNLVTHQGETLCVSEWARRVGMRQSALQRRLDAGWSFESAITAPKRPGHVPANLREIRTCGRKLQPADVRAIRANYSAGANVKMMAASYGVSETIIYSILKGRAWATIV